MCPDIRPLLIEGRPQLILGLLGQGQALGARGHMTSQTERLLGIQPHGGL
jgi:hypothetical protein